MTIIIFAGPTLSAAEVCAEIDAVVLPPVAQGDLYRVSLERPTAIGIIDGYFERIPAVWHKEILWAMAHEIHVFGSASIGALRAAELAAFGMEGVGEIFQAFQRGELEDDDEVAVAHGPAEDGFRPVSEAMVNIRATLRAAVVAGALRPETQLVLERIAKDTFFLERSYPRMLARAAQAGVRQDEQAAFKAFLETGRINQKRADAVAMLRHMRARFANDPTPKQVSYSFEHTETWEEMRRRARRLPLGAARRPGEVGAAYERLLEELKVSGRFAAARRGAMARALALEEATRTKRPDAKAPLEQAATAFRSARGLHEASALERWTLENRLTPIELERLLEDERRIAAIEEAMEMDILRALPDYLRVTGEYGPILDRIRDKQLALTARGLESPTFADAGVSEAELWHWYFEERLGLATPPDLTRYAQSAGFADEYALRQAALRERLAQAL